MKSTTKAWLLGMLIGEAVWGLALVCALAGLGGVAKLFAAPVPHLGWLLIWGDGPGRIKLVETMTFNVIFRLCFYGVVGGIVGALVHWRRSKADPV